MTDRQRGERGRKTDIDGEKREGRESGRREGERKRCRERGTEMEGEKGGCGGRGMRK